jgi:ribose 1,5-bisphosphokinase
METARSETEPPPAEKIGPGRIVVIVGPSGAGKDTLIRRARAVLADRSHIIFPQRVVTRPSDDAEDNVALTTAAFNQLLATGGFAVSWQAHGLHYGYPIDIDADVRRGACVVLNLSRTAVAATRSRFLHTKVVLIDADYELRRTRLINRKRESSSVVESRLSRETPFQTSDADIVIANNNDEASAARNLISAVDIR